MLTDEDISLPSFLPNDLVEMFELKSQPVTDNGVNKLTRKIIDHIQGLGIKPNDNYFQMASKKAITKWSPLKVKGDDAGVCIFKIFVWLDSKLCHLIFILLLQHGLKLKLKRRYEKVSRPNSESPAKRSLNFTKSTEDISLIKERLQSDWEQNLRSPAVMKTYMEQLRGTRMADAAKQSASAHIHNYPALRLSPVVSFFSLNLSFLSVKF